MKTYEEWCEENTDLIALARRMKSSLPEQYLGFYLSSVSELGTEYEKRAEWLREYSIDIFFPSLNIGVEYDGSHWHKDKMTADLEKSKLCRAEGITLIHIREEGLEKLPRNGKYTVEYSPNKDYSNIDVAIGLLCEKINHLAGTEIYVDVDVKRDREKILRYVQDKFHTRTIAYVWPESFDYWLFEENDTTPYEVFCSQHKGKYWLKCPHCGKKFELYMRYFYDRRSIIPCECEYSTRDDEHRKVVEEYKLSGKIPQLDNSLQSRRLVDCMKRRIRWWKVYKLSAEEWRLYEEMGLVSSK